MHSLNHAVLVQSVAAERAEPPATAVRALPRRPRTRAPAYPVPRGRTAFATGRPRAPASDHEMARRAVAP